MQAESGDPPGFLTFGPEQVYPTGEYRVRFLARGGAGGQPGPVGKVEVSTDQGKGFLRKGTSRAAGMEVGMIRSNSAFAWMDLRRLSSGHTTLGLEKSGSTLSS